MSSNKKTFALIGLICSCAGAFLTLIFSIVTCARGREASKDSASLKKMLTMSNWIWGVVVALIITIVGVVFLILSIERGAQMSKMTMIAILVGCFAILYGVVTNVTICSYNSCFNSKYEKEMKKAFSSWY
ncbi:MAG: hypothetical protein II919_06390 [Lachnospiraceae bacterium]|nr:hypothetical protein [Lachnospiraceae bacterium]